jgi:hypothetical protein
MVAGCVKRPPAERATEQPRSYEEVAALITAIKAYQRRIGYRDTRNFLSFAGQKESFPFCGYVSPFYLPYSYEDPAVKWLESVTEEACRAQAKDADVYYGTSEAVGERAAPVTTSLLAAPIDRLLYVVIHEDCHEQFELPHGVEEAVCNVIAYRGMEAFSAEHFGAGSAEHALVQKYARESVNQAYATVAFYDQLAALYGRHARSEATADVVLRQRQTIFRRAEEVLGWGTGQMNNVVMANGMTYSRHYPAAANVYEAVGRDLARTIELFRKVDAQKPAESEVMEKRGIKARASLEFIRAYEAAIVEAIETALATRP